MGRFAHQGREPEEHAAQRGYAPSGQVTVPANGKTVVTASFDTKF